MRNFILLVFCLLFSGKVFSQNLYFPPLVGKSWDTLSPKQLGWCIPQIDTLYQYLGSSKSKSFMVLVDGKIVLEKYFGSFKEDSFWYWASAGKTLTAMVVGIAQEQGFLKLEDTSSKYLGVGWTNLPAAKENLIKIRHQISMTSGLDDGPMVNDDCTIDSCLKYKADAGSRWAYHNAPYTLLDKVVSNATGQTYQQYFNTVIRNKTGMNGLWLKIDFNNVFFSNTRSMARYGLVLLNRGKWDQTEIIADSAYFNQMIKPSQNLNPGYGYLTWLNGSSTHMLPGSQFVFNGMILPDAPSDMYAAMGRDGQFLMVVPSQKLIVIRMGNDPQDGSLVPTTYANSIWKQLNKVMCNQPNGLNPTEKDSEVMLFPNPVKSVFEIVGIDHSKLKEVVIYDASGHLVQTDNPELTVDIGGLAPGIYFVEMSIEGNRIWRKIVKDN